MKHTLILPIVVLAILAFAIPDAAAAPCEGYDMAVYRANRVLDRAKEALRLEEKKDDVHFAADHFIPGNTNTGIFCPDCMNNALAISQAKTAVKAAEKARDDAQAAYDSCLAGYICSNCNQIGSHLVDPQPTCTHTVYSCQGSSVGTHVQVTCESCKQTYWQCGSGGSVHQQMTCTSSRRVGYTNNVVRGKIVRGGYRMVYFTGCGKTYWTCKNEANHGRTTGCPVSGCGIRKYGCATTYSCATKHALNGEAVGSTTTTTTSPTVQNNGGGTTGGTTGGTSSDRVRCGHSNCQRGGYASSREAHKTTCPAGHRYYECSLGGNRFHANCRARRSGEVRCARGGLCRSGGYASSRTAHQTTCGRGHTYWSCWPASVSYHRRH